MHFGSVGIWWLWRPLRRVEQIYEVWDLHGVCKCDVADLVSFANGSDYEEGWDEWDRKGWVMDSAHVGDEYPANKNRMGNGYFSSSCSVV